VNDTIQGLEDYANGRDRFAKNFDLPVKKAIFYLFFKTLLGTHQKVAVFCCGAKLGLTQP